MARKKKPKPEEQPKDSPIPGALAHVLITLSNWGGRSLFLVALVWVIRAAHPSIQALAGKQTSIGVTLSISVVWGAAASVGWAVSSKKNKAQSAELIRLRERQSVLEALKGEPKNR